MGFTRYYCTAGGAEETVILQNILYIPLLLTLNFLQFS